MLAPADSHDAKVLYAPMVNWSNRKSMWPGSEVTGAFPANSGTIWMREFQFAEPTKNPEKRTPATSGSAISRSGGWSCARTGRAPKAMKKTIPDSTTSAHARMEDSPQDERTNWRPGAPEGAAATLARCFRPARAVGESGLRVRGQAAVRSLRHAPAQEQD